METFAAFLPGFLHLKQGQVLNNDASGFYCTVRRFC